MKKEYIYLLLTILIFILSEIAFDKWIIDASKNVKIIFLIVLMSISVIAISRVKDKETVNTKL